LPLAPLTRRRPAPQRHHPGGSAGEAGRRWRRREGQPLCDRRVAPGRHRGCAPMPAPPAVP